MFRYPESAKPMLDDMLGSQGPALSQAEAEALCQILIEMPDVGNWKESARRILPRYPAAVKSVLAREVSGSDKEKVLRAEQWQDDLQTNGGAVERRKRTESSSGINSGERPGANSQPATQKGVSLRPLDPVEVDNVGVSVDGLPASLAFVNQSSAAVDIYWIDKKGNRVLYARDVKTGSTWAIATYTRHLWLIVVSGSGGTLAQGTGTRLAGFAAVTPRDPRDPFLRDTAIIMDPAGTVSERPHSTSVQPARTAGGADNGGHQRSQPRLTRQAGPEFSKIGVTVNVKGAVTLSFTVLPNGTASNFKIVTPLGFGLEEKAIEAVRKWRFDPCKEDGIEVPCHASAEVRFDLGNGKERPRNWSSGPLLFSPGDGRPPELLDGNIPPPGGEPSDESVVLEFVVTAGGAVSDVRSLHGSASSVNSMRGYLEQWKFRPAERDGRMVESLARVRFLRGRGDDEAREKLLPPAIHLSGSDSGNVISTRRFEVLAVGKTTPSQMLAPDAEGWEAIRGSSAIELFEAFLKEYPKSQYAGAARLKIAALRGGSE